VRHGSALRNT